MILSTKLMIIFGFIKSSLHTKFEQNQNRIITINAQIYIVKKRDKIPPMGRIHGH